MEIILENYKLIKLNNSNSKDLNFIKNLFIDEETVTYLGHLERDLNNTYIIANNNNDYIGYLSTTNVITNINNLTSITLYYAIDKKYQNLGHGTNMLIEVSNYLLNTVDMLVLMIDVNNKKSAKMAEKALFKEEFRDEEDIIYTKYNLVKNKSNKGK